ncbi:MAG TPA: hypothetical protein VK191_12465, partial [Symbiobacteriaceae bacterium]|nr:hypothetical protein [Symbiobacteriaceae bacterium]
PAVGPSGRLVPAELAGTEPLELVQFDDTESVYALIGQVRVGESEYAFFTTGPLVQTGALVEAYRQEWEGDVAVYVPVDSAEESAVAVAWQAILPAS